MIQGNQALFRRWSYLHAVITLYLLWGMPAYQLWAVLPVAAAILFGVYELIWVLWGRGSRSLWFKWLIILLRAAAAYPLAYLDPTCTARSALYDPVIPSNEHDVCVNLGWTPYLKCMVSGFLLGDALVCLILVTMTTVAVLILTYRWASEDAVERERRTEITHIVVVSLSEPPRAYSFREEGKVQEDEYTRPGTVDEDKECARESDIH